MIISGNGVELEVEASPPAASSVPVLVMAHPHPRMGGTKENKVIDQLFRRGSEKGWGVVRFNFRGAGASTGMFDQGRGESEDFLSVIHWTEEEFGIGEERLTALGYSFGSWIVAKTWNRVPKVKNLVLIAPPLTFEAFAELKNCDRPKFIFAAEKDEFAPQDKLNLWFESLPPPKTLEVIPGAEHFFHKHVKELTTKIITMLGSE